MKDKDIVKIAYEIKDRIYKELGFTVNVGVASNKLLAKMASDFEKPNKVHTLFDSEIQSKMWPLNIADLYGIGKMTIPKLLKMNIKTIGDLAQSDKKYILRKFGKYGNMIWDHANGIDNSPVEERNQPPKSIGNQETLPKDLYTKEEIEKVLAQIAEEVTFRLRKYNLLGTVISVNLRTNKFEDYSHQKKLLNPTSNTKEVIIAAKEVLKEMELKGPIRQVGLKLDKLTSSEEYQISLFDEDSNNTSHNKLEKLDKTLDELKAKYGYTKITRGSSLK
jgi:DNA polymerase-4